MSDVKPLIHWLCSMNLFEVGEKSKAKKKLKYFCYPFNEQACGLTRYVFYLLTKSAFGFSSSL